MKKPIKLLKITLVPILILVFLVSLTAGLFRKIEKVEETSYSYFEYVLEGQNFGFRKYDSKVCYVDENGETDCLVDGSNISVTVDGVKIDAIAADDLSTISILVVDPEAGTEAEPTYLIFTKGEEPIVVFNQKVTVYSDYVVNLLGLDKFEDEVGEHYFNSIFCSLAGTSFTTLAYLVLKTLKNRKKIGKKQKPVESSLKSKIPTTTSVNPTQGNHNLKF
jgi:hypothetical protein